MTGMDLELTINTDNDAFQGDNLAIETARILTVLAQRIFDGAINPGDRASLKDSNGNTVGVADWNTP